MHLPICSIVGLKVTSHDVVDNGYETADDNETVDDVEETSHVWTTMEYQPQGYDLHRVKSHIDLWVQLCHFLKLE